MTTHYGTGSRPTGAASTDPDEIRRGIEQTQAKLSSDVDALAGRMTPGRAVDRRVARVRATAAHGAARLRGTAVRWKDKVMGGSTDHGAGAHHSTATTHDAARHQAGSVSGTTSTGAPGVPDTAPTGVPDTAPTGVFNAAPTGVPNAASTGISDAASTVSDAGGTTADAVSGAPRAARRQAQGNPLAAGLIAFGAGWLVSSLLPATRRERELAAQARHRAAELGAPAAEAAKQAATEVKDHLAEPAQQAVDSMRTTATEAGRSVADEGRSAVGRVRGRAQESAGTMRENAPS